MNTIACPSPKSRIASRGLAARWSSLLCVFVLSLLRVNCDGNSYLANFIGTGLTPSYGGTTSGGGFVTPPGSPKMLTATPNAGYAFENWTDGAGNVVSTSASFSYTLGEGAHVALVAHFKLAGGGGPDWRELFVTVSPGAKQTKVPGDTFEYVATVRDGWGEPVYFASVRLEKPASWPVPQSNGGDPIVISGGVGNPTDSNGQFTLSSTVPVGTAYGTYTLKFIAGKQGYTSADTSAQIQITTSTQLPYVTWLPDDNSAAMDFGSVQVGTAAVRTMVIRNLGNSTLTVSSIDFPAGFTGDWPGGEIEAGGSQQVGVTFFPITGGDFSENVTVNSDQIGGSGAAHVSGTRVADPQWLQNQATYYYNYFSSRGDPGSAGYYFNYYQGLATKIAYEAQGKATLGLGYFYAYVGQAEYAELSSMGFMANAFYRLFWYYAHAMYHINMANGDSAGAASAYNQYIHLAETYRTYLLTIYRY